MHPASAVSAHDPQPHDLLWGLPVAALPSDAPDWVREVIGQGHPVVVRRAVTDPEAIAVGVRGPRREQRYATLMPRAAIERRVQPEQLIDLPQVSEPAWPALRALQQAKPILDALGPVWGVSGSAGFELASGVAALHQDSDLDLILRTPQPLSRAGAADLLGALQGLACRIDLQLQTPYGAVALAEWAGGSREVLLKNASGACLTANPWQPAEVRP